MSNGDLSSKRPEMSTDLCQRRWVSGRWLAGDRSLLILKRFFVEEDECMVSLVLGGVGESEYIVASESTSSETLSSSETGIGDDGVGDSFLSSLEDFLRPAVLGGCLPCLTFIFLLEVPSPDNLSSSFTELIMDIDDPSKSCNDCDEGPIWEDHLRENMSHQSFFDTELARMNSPEMPPVIFLTALSWESIHARRFLMVRSIFFPRSIGFPTISPYKSEKERFFVEELEVDLARRTDDSVLEVVFESGFRCFIEEHFWLLCDFGGRCGCLSLNYSFGRHSQRVKLLA
ncbi:uncharacterized protein G2W53_026865 [Senna tora]|uniref:Uncharacterized protein n=1 Tax=Senna tora TaxID=362788 RepID=A0A834TI88_9FABA|nr:uncharacterized protein G2W53_026865 [Senna tora]